MPCVGRSPGRPFGICAALAIGLTPGTVATCSVSAQGLVTTPCPMNGAYDCAVFDVPTRDVREARRYGLCMFSADCEQAQRVLPGGLHCF